MHLLREQRTVTPPLRSVNWCDSQTEQKKAALRSLFELKDASGPSVELFFGPTLPAGHEQRWIQTRLRERLVRLLPHLGARGSGVRWDVEAR